PCAIYVPMTIVSDIVSSRLRLCSCRPEWHRRRVDPRQLGQDRYVRRLLEGSPSRAVLLTGDIHSNWVNDRHVDYRKLEAPVVATEVVRTPIISGGHGPAEGTGSGPGSQSYVLRVMLAWHRGL